MRYGFSRTRSIMCSTMHSATHRVDDFQSLQSIFLVMRCTDVLAEPADARAHALRTARGIPRVAADPGTGRHVSGLTAFSAVSAAQTPSSNTNSLNASAQANSVTNSISNGRGWKLHRQCGQHGSRDPGAAAGPGVVSQQPHGDSGQPQSGLVARNDFFQLPRRILSGAAAAIDKAMRDLGIRPRIRGSFAGAGQVTPIDVDHAALVLAALAARLYVLGILYETPCIR